VKTIISMAISLIIFSIMIYVFQLPALNDLSLLIYPLISSIICSMTVYKISNSTIVTYISLVINNLVLIFILIPLSGGIDYYGSNLQFVFSHYENHVFFKYLTLFAISSFLIGCLTVKVCLILSGYRYRSRKIYVSDRTMKKFFNEDFN
jgi:hypothetical protein